MRTGNFTSSEIGALMTNGKKEGGLGAPALTYIEEKNMERRLGRALRTEVDARATDWGNCLEPYVLDMLGIEYSSVSKNVIVHPDFDFWSGMPDTKCFNGEPAVGDIKCPYTLKSFCQLVDGWAINGIQGIRDNHKDGEKFYWQLVSNAILTDCNEGELIVFCPYNYELNMIDLHEYSWMAYSDLPSLVPDLHYKNLNKFRFPIPQADKDALRNRVEIAGERLIPRMKLVNA